MLFTNGKIYDVKIFTVSFALVLSAVYLGIFAYVDRKDKEQFELYSRVVADMCDLCMEKGRITADDFDEVKERFNYLEFEELDLNDYGIEHFDDEKFYSARIGDGLMINSSLDISTSSDGSFSFSAEADRLMYQFDLTLRYFKTSRYIFYNNRWEGSDDAALYIADFLDNVQPGDSIDDYLMKVKETGSDFSYSYNADTQLESESEGYYTNGESFGAGLSGYDATDIWNSTELYTTCLDMSGLFGQWYYHISADNGKFVAVWEMID